MVRAGLSASNALQPDDIEQYRRLRQLVSVTDAPITAYDLPMTNTHEPPMTAMRELIAGLARHTREGAG
jgi:hypothetical protein